MVRGGNAGQHIHSASVLGALFEGYYKNVPFFVLEPGNLSSAPKNWRVDLMRICTNVLY